MIKTTLILLISIAWLSQSFAEEGAEFGAALTLSESMGLATAVQLFETQEHQKSVLVTGKVVQVCQKKGCWMMLVEDDIAVRVTFEDYGFFVPKDLEGRSVLAEGRFEKKTLTQGQVRHYMKDEGKSRAEIRQAKGPKEVLHFVAGGVKAL